MFNRKNYCHNLLCMGKNDLAFLLAHVMLLHPLWIPTNINFVFASAHPLQSAPDEHFNNVADQGLIDRQALSHYQLISRHNLPFLRSLTQR